MPEVLIVEDDIPFCRLLERFLQRHDFQVVTSYSAKEAISRLQRNTFSLILTDLKLPDLNGIVLLEQIKKMYPTIPVVVMTIDTEVTSAVTAMKKGAFDYITKPFTPEEMLLVISTALNSRKNDVPVPSGGEMAIQNSTPDVRGIIGISEASKQLQDYVQLVAPTTLSVLISGESGTGKEVVARQIHRESKRRAAVFVAVDCGAIPKELATSEFFGHTKGSFTGANASKEGYFEAANKGTLFLDEIGNLSYENQIQLLRVLQEHKIKRLGSTQEITVDIRIVAATNENLQQLVNEGKFREDLYHRLNEFSIEMPSLRDRVDDLPLFYHYFLEKANQQLDRKVKCFSPEVEMAFTNYRWPGNLRELQNVIKRAVLLSPGTTIEKEVLPPPLYSRTAVDTAEMEAKFSKLEHEKRHILRVLQHTNFNKTEAAKLLKITRKTLYNKINQYNMDV
ncbi:MAG: sigma-54 dependent transcriptional regulator [Bacteroidota bacterium]